MFPPLPLIFSSALSVFLPCSEKSSMKALAETLPKVLITDVDLNWLQVKITLATVGMICRCGSCKLVFR